jgi:hypothetical protein
MMETSLIKRAIVLGLDRCFLGLIRNDNELVR